MKNYIIGIGGLKNSGKDTVASMINYIFAKGVTAANYQDWYLRRMAYDDKYNDRIIHFADSLKDILSIIYNIPRSAFEDRKYKDEYWYCFETNSFIEDKLVHNNGYNIIDIGILSDNNSIKDILTTYDGISNIIKLRTLMQYFGTDVCRNKLSDNIWIRSAMGKIVDKAYARRVCIVPDVRFSNEADAIRNTNDFSTGKVLLINRNINDNNDKHDSEQLNFTADYVIDNNSTLFNLFYKVTNVISNIIKL